MYLKDIENAQPPDEAGRFARVIRACRERELPIVAAPE